MDFQTLNNTQRKSTMRAVRLIGLPIVTGVAVVIFAIPSIAQVTDPAPGQAVPKDTLTRQANPPTSTDENLSEKLSRTEGVITPPASATDEGIHKQAPAPNTDPEAVIPPQGDLNKKSDVRPR